MNNNRFLVRLEAGPLPLLSDGAMGTQLHARGVSLGTCFDALNVTQPELVAEIHRAYLVAGAEMIQTNTFGANRFKLARHDLETQLGAINRAGVELARRVAAEFPGRTVLIAGDVGPLGVRLAPFGRVQLEEARAAFAEQIRALVEAGVDLILIETISDLYEAREAVAAAREVCDLPVLVSMTFTRDNVTLLGDSPAKVARVLSETGADVIGVNCSVGPAQALRIAQQMRQAVPAARLSVMPNAGWPEQVGDRVMYPAGPEYFAEYTQAFREIGATVVGGCCGTTPAHIAAMRAALDAPAPAALQLLSALPQEEESVAADEHPSRLAQKLAAGEFVYMAELDPPRGPAAKKLLAGASLLAEAGVDVISVADSPMARMRMSPWGLCALIQQQLGVETTLHFPTRGRNLLRLQGDLLAAHALGVRNVFVVLGDPTTIGDYPQASNNYDLITPGLIKLIKEHFNQGRDYSGAELNQPTQFFVGCAANPAAMDLDEELRNLRGKLEAGADFILTQPVFDLETLQNYLERYAERFGPLERPLIVGVLPLYSYRHAEFLHHEVPGITIPERFRQRMREAGNEAMWEGVRIAAEFISAAKALVQGVYIMPAFNRFDLVAALLEQARGTEKGQA